MESKDLILVKSEEAYLERHRRKGAVKLKRAAFRLFLLILALGAILCVIFLLPQIKSFIDQGALGGIFSPNDTTDVTENPNGSGTPNGGNGTGTPNGGGGAQGGGGITQGGTDTGANTKVPAGAYKIKETTLEYGVKNETEIELNLDAPHLISISEIRKKYGGEAPLVLITHLSPREAYSNGEYYTADSDFYKENENISALAKVLTNELNALGIKTLYLNEEYAKGSVFGTLDEYEKSLNETLSRYPSISYVFSLSRGIYINDDMSIDRETVGIDGKSCAQIRIVSGTSGEKLTEAFAQSLSFALDFAKFSGEKSKNFVCESKIARFPLGQGVSPFALEFELGTYANTYDEAQNSTVHLSKLIFEYLSALEGA